MASIFPAFALAWMSAQLAPCSFIRRCRSATTSPLPDFDMELLAHPAAMPRAKPPMTITLALSLSRPFILPPVAARLRASAPGRLVKVSSLVDPVLDGRNGLQVLGDGQTVGLGQILVTGRRTLDDLRHQPAGDVTVGPVARLEVVRDLLFTPAPDAGVPVRSDVGHRGAFRPFALRRAGQEAAVVHRHRHGPRGVAFTAV